MRALQYDDLEDSMTDALVNDKPQFVRLFTENGLNILEYLTYERLESLYQSLSTNTLAYTLLQALLRERHHLASSQTGSPDSADGNLKSPVRRPSSALRLSLLEVRGHSAKHTSEFHSSCRSVFSNAVLSPRSLGY